MGRGQEKAAIEAADRRRPQLRAAADRCLDAMREFNEAMGAADALGVKCGVQLIAWPPKGEKQRMILVGAFFEEFGSLNPPEPRIQAVSLDARMPRPAGVELKRPAT